MGFSDGYINPRNKDKALTPSRLLYQTELFPSFFSSMIMDDFKILAFKFADSKI
jgi:hypothetical protein